ncbi:hypothetical protein ACFL5K_06275, partial [Gemmatimonadota bacterium]
RADEAEERISHKYLKNFDSIRKVQDALIAKARQNEIFTVDNVDFDETVGNIIQFLTRRMGELVELDVSVYEQTKEATTHESQ